MGRNGDLVLVSGPNDAQNITLVQWNGTSHDSATWFTINVKEQEVFMSNDYFLIHGSADSGLFNGGQTNSTETSSFNCF